MLWVRSHSLEELGNMSWIRLRKKTQSWEDEEERVEGWLWEQLGEEYEYD